MKFEKFKLNSPDNNRALIYKNEELSRELLQRAIAYARTLPRSTGIKGAQIKYAIYRFDRNTKRTDYRIKKVYHMPDGSYKVRSKLGKLSPAQAYIIRAKTYGAIV